MAVWEKVKSPPLEGRGVSPVRGADGALGGRAGPGEGQKVLSAHAVFPGDGCEHNSHPGFPGAN